jgi:dihydroorotate dehydrogenase
MALLGFGFIEIGTVTPRPQAGNQKPRMFRLPADEALINRMGFNNDGMEAVAARLQKRPQNIIVGCNIGKNKDTPAEQAVHDYLACFKCLAPLTDYTTVNVSSPNTPGLRDLLALKPLKELLQALTEANAKWRKPLFLKLSPDMANDDIVEVTRLCADLGLAGIIATNTTVNRTGLQTADRQLQKMGSGGLSGKPLFDRSTQVLRLIRQVLDGHPMTLIASGGIHSPLDAKQKLAAGADLVQLYTGLVYEGPGLVRAIVKSI